MTVAEVVDGVVIVERRFAASQDRVWSAFTEPELMARWMWAGLGRNPRASVDLRPGGEYRVAIDEEPGKDGWDSAERAFEGVFVTVDPPHRLAYSLRWDAPVGYNQQGVAVPDELIEMESVATEEGTVVRYRHSGVPDDVSRRGHLAATVAMFDLLEQVLSGSD